VPAQVSELSHRSGTAEGRARSLEDEAARLRSANQQLAAERHDKEVASNEFKSRMTVLDEKVRVCGHVCVHGLVASNEFKSRVTVLDKKVARLWMCVHVGA